MHLSDLTTLHFVVTLMQGGALGVLLCFIGLECLGRSQAAHERPPPVLQQNAPLPLHDAIDAEWAEINTNRSHYQLKRWV